MQRELQEIRTLLHATPASAAAPTEPETSPSPSPTSRASAREGESWFSSTSPTIIDRSARATSGDDGPARERVHQDGKLRYVVRDFPLEAIHPQAFRAAEATHCGRDQGSTGRCTTSSSPTNASLAVGDLPATRKRSGSTCGVPGSSTANKARLRVRADLPRPARRDLRSRPSSSGRSTDIRR